MKLKPKTSCVSQRFSGGLCADFASLRSSTVVSARIESPGRVDNKNVLGLDVTPKTRDTRAF